MKNEGVKAAISITFSAKIKYEGDDCYSLTGVTEAVHSLRKLHSEKVSMGGDAMDGRMVMVEIEMDSE